MKRAKVSIKNIFYQAGMRDLINTNATAKTYSGEASTAPDMILENSPG